MRKNIAVGLVLSAVTAVAFAGPLEDTIRNRRSSYGFLAWNCGKIKAQAVDHPETFNKEQVIAAADAVAATANSGLLDLYVPGSDQGTGWKPSRLKPEYFQKQDEIKEIEATFIKVGDELQTVAATGDIAGSRANSGIGAACKSCHDLIRVKE